jgi:hypothetical protein
MEQLKINEETEAALILDSQIAANGEEPIIVDIDKLTIGDLETLDKASARKLSTVELIEFLEGIVVGGIRHLPIKRLGDVIKALGNAVSESANPKN